MPGLEHPNPNQPPPVPFDRLDARSVWIIDGGPRAPKRLPPGAPTCVIAADRGLLHALRLGLVPDVAVGDFDSVPAGALADAARQHPALVVLRHSPNKNRSDLDLALSLAFGLDAGAISLASGGGGRLDHLLTSLTLLARPRYAALNLTGYVGDSVVRAATVGMALELDSGDGNLVTLTALGGKALLETSGLRWNLDPSTPLASGASLGLSNEIVGTSAAVAVASGTVLAIQTHGRPIA